MATPRINPEARDLTKIERVSDKTTVPFGIDHDKAHEAAHRPGDTGELEDLFVNVAKIRPAR